MRTDSVVVVLATLFTTVAKSHPKMHREEFWAAVPTVIVKAHSQHRRNLHRQALPEEIEHTERPFTSDMTEDEYNHPTLPSIEVMSR